MTTMRLVAKYKSWTRVERECLAGQLVELDEPTDYKGKRLAVLLTGPLTGAGVWIGADEIAEECAENPEGMIDIA